LRARPHRSHRSRAAAGVGAGAGAGRGAGADGGGGARPGRPHPGTRGTPGESGRRRGAFEEVGRSLRHRLRSTESINIDLEREVRRRTEGLEQKNAELYGALEKLRLAQDNLVRSEKLASV